MTPLSPPEPENEGIPPEEDAEVVLDWDQWWQEQIAQGRIRRYRNPVFQTPLVPYRGRHHDLANGNHLLVEIMKSCGFHSILCAGNGASREAYALAVAGFHVTALDLSPTATDLAGQAAQAGHGSSLGIRRARAGGQLELVTGDLFDMTECPGPYDVIIERRMTHTFPVRKREAALRALAGRLAPVGILLSQARFEPHRPEQNGKPFHAAQAWFQQQAWTIWNSAPEPPPTGRVAWLVHYV